MRDREDIELFLKGVPFYKSPTNFCLGNTMEEAGTIVRQLMADKKKREQEAAAEKCKECTSKLNSNCGNEK